MLRSKCLLKNIPRYPHTGSDEAFLLAASWLYRCISMHPDCYASILEAPCLPSRVIDVGPMDSRDPLLYESREGERAVYCTLSYRWPRNAVKTTQATLAQFKQRISFQGLPRTIQDSITIARKLGFRYIWVDALCIIQDSQMDWTREAANMHTIYRCSTLTIAALTASDSQPGIFQPILQDRPHRWSHDDALLHSRGWVLQEELLSRRILSYADDAIFWSCLRINASDSEPERSTPDTIHRTEDNHRFKRVLAGHRPTETKWEDYAYWLWRRAMTQYTMRNLTYEKDRLDAISGVASTFASVLNDVLVAGIWKHHLAEHLAWWVGSQSLSPRHLAYAGLEDFENGLVSANSRSNSFAAPSWSWLSVRSPITYANASKYGDGIGTNFSNERQNAGDFIDMTEILDIDMRSTAQTVDIRGTIKLRGSLMKVYIRRGVWRYKLYLSPGSPDEREDVDRPYSPGPQLDNDGRPRPSDDQWETWFPDAPISSTHPLRFDPLRENELFCFHLGNGGDLHTHLFQFCLCLIRTGRKEHEYERVGFCAWNPRHVDLRCPELQEKFRVFPGDRFKGFTASTLETISIV